jgi:hypothetical protein
VLIATALSSPVKAGLLGSLLLLVLLAAALLQGTRRILDEPPESSCPLEDPQ